MMNINNLPPANIPQEKWFEVKSQKLLKYSAVTW